MKTMTAKWEIFGFIFLLTVNLWLTIVSVVQRWRFVESLIMCAVTAISMYGLIDVAIKYAAH